MRKTPRTVEERRAFLRSADHALENYERVLRSLAKDPECTLEQLVELSTTKPPGGRFAFLDGYLP